MLPIELHDEIVRFLPPKIQIKWFHSYVDNNLSMEEIYRNAIINDDIKLITLLFKYNVNYIFIRDALELAANNGHIEIVKFLYSQHGIICDYVIDVRYSSTIASWFPLDLRTTMQDLMLMIDCESNTCAAARKNGHLDIVDWIKSNKQTPCRDRSYSNEIIQKVLEKRDLKKQLGIF
ncbi:MAG: hypothetical protein ACRCZI_12895 [Cetobacterium sp.]